MVYLFVGVHVRKLSTGVVVGVPHLTVDLRLVEDDLLFVVGRDPCAACAPARIGLGVLCEGVWLFPVVVSAGSDPDFVAQGLVDQAMLTGNAP